MFFSMRPAATFFHRMLLPPILLLAALPGNALQQGADQFQSQAHLVTALVDSRRDERQLTVLLEHNSRLVTQDLWRSLIDAASLNYYGTSDRAFDIYHVAAVVAERLQEKRLLASTYYYVGRAHSGLGQIPQAIDAYEQCRKTFAEAGLQRDIIYVLSDLGSLFLNLGDYEKARDYSEQSIALADRLKNERVEAGAWPDQYGVAKAMSNLGNVSVWQGDYAQALLHLRESLALYRQLNVGTSAYDAYVAETLADVGSVQSARGDNAEALINLNEALRVAETLPDRSRAAYVLNSMGILYLEQEDFSKASACFDRSLQIYSTMNNRLEAARIGINIGVMRFRQGEYDGALKFFQDSLQVTQNTSVALAAEQNIGAVYRAQGKYELASEWLNKNLARARESGNPVRLMEALWRQSEVLYAKGDYAEAIALATNALNLARKHNLLKHSYLALTSLGRCYRAGKNYEQAFAALRQAIEIVERLRVHVVGGEQGRQRFLENSIAPYHEMFLLLMEQNRVPEAFAYAERAKGRVLLDILRDGKVNVTKAMSSGDRSRERELDQAIVSLNNSISRESLRDEPDQIHLDELTFKLGKARLAHEMFLAGLYVAHPELRKLRGELPPVTTEQMLALIPDDKLAVLEYVVTEQKPYLLVLTRQASPGGGREEPRIDLRAYRLGLSTEELSKRVSAFRTQVSDRAIIPESAYRSLYDLLIKPAEAQLAGKKTLCIVPDGALWELPFQALRRGAKFLAEDYAFFYTPSLSVLREMTRQVPDENRRAASLRTLLAFANPNVDSAAVDKVSVERSKKLAPLPEAEKEVWAVAGLYDLKQSRVYTGAEALEERAKEEAGKYDVLHFATHGLLDDHNPMYSYLVLAQGKIGGRDDGLLEAREIIELDLRARLVLLSACETGRGRVSAGEGVIGMTWAFFVAGAPAVVASLWGVDSAGSSRLIVEFHRHLATGSAGKAGVPVKAAALQEAQLKLLRSEGFDHPFYWAGFSLYGDPR